MIDTRSGLTKRQKNDLLWAQLDLEFSSFRPQYRDLADYLMPTRARFNITDGNRGDRRNQKIFDGTGTKALRTLSSGMMSGITSPARPWKRLGTADPDLMKSPRVKEWLWQVDRRMDSVFSNSNFYNVLPILYGDLGGFGTAPIFMEEDFEQTIRCQSFGIGAYRIAKDARGIVNVFAREFRMTVRQLIQKFGRKDDQGDPDWSVFSQHVKNLWDKGQYEIWIDVRHIIQPNEDYDSKRGTLDSKFKKFSSCYYEKGSTNGNAYVTAGDTDRYLRESGYDICPVMCPRWEVNGEDVYGTNCPGMISVGDIKQLQWGEGKIAKAIDKMIDPAMTGPTSLRSQKASILPGDITYVDSNTQTGGFRAAHEVNFRVDYAEQKQAQIRQRIREYFYEDLFLMLAGDNDPNRTATEVVERKEEKLLALGPVYEQLNQDLLDPAIQGAFHYMQNFNMIPPLPEELHGVDLKVDYISVMAQAQRVIGIGTLERFAGFIVNLGQLDPNVRHKINSFGFVDQYGDALSIQPGIIRSDEEANGLLQQQQQQMAQQQMAEQSAAAAKSVKDLSQSSLEGDSALKRLTDQANAGSLVQ